jgi:hypothetical protein
VGDTLPAYFSSSPPEFVTFASELIKSGRLHDLTNNVHQLEIDFQHNVWNKLNDTIKAVSAPSSHIKKRSHSTSILLKNTGRKVKPARGNQSFQHLLVIQLPLRTFTLPQFPKKYQEIWMMVMVMVPRSQKWGMHLFEGEK